MNQLFQGDISIKSPLEQNWLICQHLSLSSFCRISVLQVFFFQSYSSEWYCLHLSVWLLFGKMKLKHWHVCFSSWERWIWWFKKCCPYVTGWLADECLAPWVFVWCTESCLWFRFGTGVPSLPWIELSMPTDLFFASDGQGSSSGAGIGGGGLGKSR